MSGIAIGARQRFAPTAPKINPSHPLAAHIAAYFYCPLLINLVNNTIGVANSRPSLPSTFGTSFNFNQDSALSSSLGFTSGPFTLASAFSISGSSFYGDSFGRQRYVSGTDNQGWVLSNDVTTMNPVLLIRANNETGTLAGSSALSGTITQVGTSDGSTTVQLWINGSRVNTSTTINKSPLALSSTTGYPLYLSAYNSTTNYSSVTASAAWKRVLSANEIAMWHADPFCLLSY